MTQPPDDRQPPPPERPESPETPLDDQPTVPWTPPPADPDAPLPPPAEPPPPPDAGEQGLPPAEPPAPASPLISASPSPQLPWAPPVTAAAEVAPGLVFADTLSRFVAFAIDIILLLIVGTIIGAVAGWGQSGAIGANGSFGPVAIQRSIMAVVLSGLYFVTSWSGGRRATLGQRLFRIQVGNAFDGRPLTLEQAIRRWLGLGDFLGLFVVIPGLGGLAGTAGFLWYIVLLITTLTSPTKQGLHDRLANTAVVRPANAGNGLAVGCFIALFVIPIALVIAAVALVGAPQISTILSQIGDSI